MLFFGSEPKVNNEYYTTIASTTTESFFLSAQTTIVKSGQNNPPVWLFCRLANYYGNAGNLPSFAVHALVDN